MYICIYTSICNLKHTYIYIYKYTYIYVCFRLEVILVVLVENQVHFMSIISHRTFHKDH